MKRARILIVDDEPNILQTLRQVLAEQYDIDVAENGVEGIVRLQQQVYELLLTDLKMPEVDGVQLMEWAKRLHPDIEVIMVTGFADISLAVKIVRKGAYTYLTKPFRLADIHMNVARALEKRQADLERRALLQKQRELEDSLLREEERRRVEEEAVLQDMSSLIKALEGKDTYTRGHSERVTVYARGLTRYLKLSSEDRIRIERSARLHDIGKIGVRESVLQKPGRLDSREFSEIQQHPALGAEIIRPITFLRDTLEGIGHHHESYDGSGYPDRLAGKDIPYVARVLAVVDTYDAMTSTRAYRVRLPRNIAVNEMLRCGGRPFDEDLMFRYRKREMLDQLHLMELQIEREFLVARVFPGLSPKLLPRFEVSDDFRDELRDMLPENHAVHEQYARLRLRIDELMDAVKDCLQQEEHVFSQIQALCEAAPREGEPPELKRLPEAIGREARFCLHTMMQPRMQFDPEVVAGFHEYITAEPPDAEIPPAFQPR